MNLVKLIPVLILDRSRNLGDFVTFLFLGGDIFLLRVNRAACKDSNDDVWFGDPEFI